MTRRLKISAICALGLMVMAAPAGAQMRPPLDGPSAEDRTRMEAHRAEMARDMHILLRLRPDQEAAWKAFEAAMAPPEPPMAPPRGAPDLAATTPQRLDEMDRRRAEGDARGARIEAAVRAFYAALSPEQQQAFDALGRLTGPMRPGPMGHGPMGPGPHGRGPGGPGGFEGPGERGPPPPPRD
ncbi:Spy/CpxP family protein refolding chaperone [Phenylobacterium aquaticum]|uniref:Spy/CpxP family protein refolding chaperone n=1 Tax=Phenylobacterium aquaticum TaxID=1763816 RepID=UPI0026F312A7|nr:Spy/CpxP family protein refolding chaperone [Phenylobacterium aquaticum]